MAKYSIEQYRKVFPHLTFKERGGDIFYQSPSGEFKYRVEDGLPEYGGGTYPDLSGDDEITMKQIHKGRYEMPEITSEPTGLLAVVRQAEKEVSLRKQIEALEEMLEAIEADENEAPTLYVVDLFGYNGFEKKRMAFVSPYEEEEEVELWYQVRGQYRNTTTWGHAFVNAKSSEHLTGRVTTYDFEDTAYAEALTAYVERLKRNG